MNNNEITDLDMKALKEAEKFLKMPHNIEVIWFERRGKGMYQARTPDIVGSIGVGKTLDEALDSMFRGKMAMIAHILRDGLKVPEAKGKLSFYLDFHEPFPDITYTDLRKAIENFGHKHGLSATISLEIEF